MKKLLLIFLLSTLSLSYFSTLALAACSPPSDYSSCPTALFGPKIAGNIDPKNYQQIRQQYNQANPSLVNQQIPVTIIYTTADLAPGNLQNLANNLRAMQQSGLQPVIRIASSGFGAQGWAPITTTEAAAAAQTLNQAFSQIIFSQTPVVYFGNEPNLAGEWGGQANAQSFAQSFAAFIQAAGAQRNFLVFVPPVATHQAGVEYAFMQQILSYQLANGKTIAESVDGAALTIYNGDAQSLSALYQQLTQFYGQNGINNFVISEIGPLVNGQLLQNQSQINQWAQIMSGVFAAINANSSLFAGAKYISTSFFLDTNGDGNPDVTLLVIIDKDGNVIIMNLLSLGGGIMTTPTFGTCLAEQPFPGGVETKGESFTVEVTSCFSLLDDPAKTIEPLLWTSQLDFPQNEPIATELKEPLDKLKPYGYAPQVSEHTALGKITYDVCEEGTTNWYLVEKEVEFKTPAWLQKMTTEGKELASWLVPGGGQGSVMGEQTNNPQPTTDNLLAAAPQEGGSIPHGCFYWYGAAYGDCSCMNDIKANGDPNCMGEHGCCPPHSKRGICGWEDCQPQTRCEVGELSNPCPGDFFGGPQPTPAPKICQAYTPKGGGVPPEIVCVAGQCFIKGVSFGNPLPALFEELGKDILKLIKLTPVCSSKNFVVTPKIRTPFVRSADTFLREQTLSIFKVPSQDAKEAFEFEHALENAQHEFAASPADLFSSQTEIYGQRGVKDSYEWVQNALMPPGYQQY